jgi:hypothetical protein
MSKAPIIYHGITFDSHEEREFFYWLEEAQELGLVESFVYQPPSFELCGTVTMDIEVPLKTKTKVISKTVLRPHSYTADYLIYPRQPLKLLGDTPHYVDIKGGFDLYHNEREFSINQKWMWCKHGVYINKVVPKVWFAQYWVPDKARYTVVRREVRKCYEQYQTKGEWVNG